MSVISYGVNPSKQKEMEERMERLGVREQDIVEKFIRSGGKGGQNVNKTATCVYLCHVPTGIEVKCQKERVQVINRFLARRMLLDRVEEKQQGIVSARQKAIEKIRRQKRKRSRRAKEKMLVAKHIQSGKKSLRGKVGAEQE